MFRISRLDCRNNPLAIALRTIALRAIALRATALRAIALRAIVFRSILSRAISLRQLQLGLLFVLTFGAAVVLTIAPPLTAQSASITQAKVSEILDGSQVFIQNQLVAVNSVANQGQQVRTGQARAELTFNTGAVGRMNPNSVMSIGSQCTQLQKGSLLINGAVNGCTSSLVAGVRGTTYVLDVTDAGEEQVSVLEGEVSVTPRLATPGNPSVPKPTFLKAGQRVGIGRDRRLSIAQQIPREEFDRLLSGPLFNRYQRQLPGRDKIQRSYGRLFPGRTFPLKPSNLRNNRPSPRKRAL